MKVTHDDVTGFLRRRIKNEAEQAWREAKGIRTDAPIARNWLHIGAELSRIDTEEAAALDWLERDHRQWSEGKEPDAPLKRSGRIENLTPGCEGDSINTKLFNLVRAKFQKRHGVTLESVKAGQDHLVNMVVDQVLKGESAKRRRAVKQRIRRLRAKRDADSQT